MVTTAGTASEESSARSWNTKIYEKERSNINSDYEDGFWENLNSKPKKKEALDCKYLKNSV